MHTYIIHSNLLSLWFFIYTPNGRYIDYSSLTYVTNIHHLTKYTVN